MDINKQRQGDVRKREGGNKNKSGEEKKGRRMRNEGESEGEINLERQNWR